MPTRTKTKRPVTTLTPQRPRAAILTDAQRDMLEVLCRINNALARDYILSVAQWQTINGIYNRAIGLGQSIAAVTTTARVLQMPAKAAG